MPFILLIFFISKGIVADKVLGLPVLTGMAGTGFINIKNIDCKSEL